MLPLKQRTIVYMLKTHVFNTKIPLSAQGIVAAARKGCSEASCASGGMERG